MAFSVMYKRGGQKALTSPLEKSRGQILPSTGRHIYHPLGGENEGKVSSGPEVKPRLALSCPQNFSCIYVCLSSPQLFGSLSVLMSVVRSYNHIAKGSSLLSSPSSGSFPVLPLLAYSLDPDLKARVPVSGLLFRDSGYQYQAIGFWDREQEERTSLRRGLHSPRVNFGHFALF